MKDQVDQYFAYLNRVSYATTKLGLDAVHSIPFIGPSIVSGVNRVCDKLHWANDYIIQKPTEQRTNLCTAAENTLAEQQLGELPAPPASTILPTPHVKETPNR